MQFVGAGFCDDVDDAAERAAEFSLIVMGIDLEFADTVDDRRHGVSARERALIVQTVSHEEVAAVGLTVDRGEEKLRTGCGIAEAAEFWETLTGDTPGERERSWVKFRPFSGRSTTCLAATTAPISSRGLLEQFAGSFDGNRLGQRAELQPDVDRRSLVHGKGDAREFP